MKAHEPDSQVMGDLGLFLEFFLDLEKKLKEADFTPAEQELIENFFKTIKNSSKCAITGGSVLQLHLHKDIKAQDIDFFISKRKTLAIIKDFFTNKNILDFISEYFENNMFSGAKESDYILKAWVPNIADSNPFVDIISAFKETTCDYGFLKNNFKLWTFQKILGNIFKLNFILVDYVPKNFSDGRVIYPSALLNTSPSKVYDTERINYLLKPHLDCILTTFDFRELKIMYDFQTESIQPVYKIALREYSKDLDYLESFEHIANVPEFDKDEQLYENFISLFFDSCPNFTYFRPKLKNFKYELKYRISEFYMPEIKNDNILTLEPYMLKKAFGAFDFTLYSDFSEIIKVVDRKIRYFSLEADLNILQNLLNLRTRIVKYKEKGFRIIDKNNLLAKMLFFNIVGNQIILGSNDIENTLRTALLSPSRESVMLYKYISENKKNMTDFFEFFDKYMQRKSDSIIPELMKI